jgi:vanillate O-demethylase monooxygenase subunit
LPDSLAINAALTKRDDDADLVFRLFFKVLPISEQMSVAFMIIQRNYAFDAPDEPFILFQDTLIEQDRLMVENQKPVLLTGNSETGYHLSSGYSSDGC